MGLLVQGVPLAWEPSKPYIKRVKRDGIIQFLSVFSAAQSLTSSGLKWGDEVEYMLVRTASATAAAPRSSTLVLSAPALLDILQRDENSQPSGSSVPVLWRPEYANWMIEGTPGVPYRCYAADLCVVEQNMALRRAAIQAQLGDGESVLTLTVFPRLGCPRYTFPETVPGGPVARSFYTSDDVINPHPRFGTLTRNIRSRRGRKVDIRVPVFQDEETVAELPVLCDDEEYLAALAKSSVGEAAAAAAAAGDTAFVTVKEAMGKNNGADIVMDSAAFGMGCCCLQVTLQAKNMSESRYLYDQLGVMAPIMLALTAATPAVRGMLADTDARWNIIAASMDDRTEAESSSGAVPKSRYSSIDCFISDRPLANAAAYNDLPVPIDSEAYERLRAGGVDHLLAQHVAHLYIRDPLVIYGDHVEQDNETSTEHFENIQSTNWNTVRFKPPPPGTDIGWRTEFRSMEVALTDFENAAFCVLSVLLSRVIVAFDLNLYIPLSCVDENMETAHVRNAAAEQSFYFRKNIFSSCSGSSFVCECGHIHHSSIVGGASKMADINKFCRESSDSEESDSESYDLLTLAEIFNGKPLCQDGRPAGFAFPGLVPLVRGYLASINLDPATSSRLETYTDFIAERASGRLCTTATFLRNFVLRHADYALDSVVSETICHDLIETCRQITSGEVGSAEMLGRFHLERFGNVESPEAMMERMGKELIGAEAGLLQGSSLPTQALHDTLQTLASEAVVANCAGC
jgi:glutamate--cysteine ligase catalytic subunit